MRHDPGLDGGYPAGRPVVVELLTRSGRRLTGRARFHPGDREHPLSPDELAAVDAALIRTPRAPAGAAELLRQLTHSPGATPLRRLTDPLRMDGPHHQAPSPTTPVHPERT